MSQRQLFVFPTLQISTTWKAGHMGWLTQCPEDRGIRSLGIPAHIPMTRVSSSLSSSSSGSVKSLSVILGAFSLWLTDPIISCSLSCWTWAYMLIQGIFLHGGRSKIRLQSQGMPHWGSWKSWVITGRRKLNKIKVRERGWPPRYFLTRSTNTRRDPDAQAGCKPQNSSRNSPFSGAKLASVKRRTILLTSCALKPLKYLPVITFIKELNFETLRWHHSEKTAFSKFTSV